MTARPMTDATHAAIADALRAAGIVATDAECRRIAEVVRPIILRAWIDWSDEALAHLRKLFPPDDEPQRCPHCESTDIREGRFRRPDGGRTVYCGHCRARLYVGSKVSPEATDDEA